MFKVLLVDDEALARESISENIKWNDLGLDLIGTSRNGEEALRFIQTNEPDIVITDICMPYMDGIELSKQLYEKYPNIKIIIFSGYDEFEYAKKAMKYKVFEYMLKPVTAHELADVLNNVILDLEKIRQEKEQIRKMESEYHKTLPLVKGKVLMDLLLGNSVEVKRSKALDELQINIHTSNMKAAYIHKANKEEAVEAENSALMSFIIYNIVEEIVNKTKEGISFQNFDQQIYIIFHTEQPRGFDNRILEICSEIQNEIKQRAHLDVTIGIGCIVHSIDQLNRSYKDAHNAIAYQYSMGANALIDISQLKSSQQLSVDKIINELVITVKSGEEESLSSITSYFYDLLKRACLTKSKAITYIQMLVTTVTKEMREYSDVKIENTDVVIDRIRSKASLEDAIRNLEDFLADLCKRQKERCEDSNTRVALMALDFIDKNYNNSEINLNSVCSYLSISPSYFSTIFKNYTGETFVDLLIKKRMQVAKNLLIQTNFKNYEIAEKVGFNDPHYFTVSFKKITGTTPKEYAKLHKKA